MRFRGFMNHVLRCSCIGILYERSILRKFNFPHAGSESLISHMLERRRRPRLSMQKETTHTRCESGRNEQKKVLNAATAKCQQMGARAACVFLQKANWAGSTGLGTPYTSPFGRAPCVASTTTDGSDGPGLVPLYFCFFSPDETYAAGCCYPFGLPSSSIIFVCSSSSTAAAQVDPIQCVVCILDSCWSLLD